MRRLCFRLAALYGQHFPFPQRKWRICLFLLGLGGIHPFRDRDAWRAFVAGRPPEDVRIDRGFRIRCHWEDTSYLAFTLLGDHQTYETDLLEKMIRPGDVIVDGGANIGFYTVLFALRSGPQGHVYAYEPVSAVAERVRENLALNADLDLAEVSFRAVGLGSEAQKLPIYLKPAVSGSGIDSQHSSVVAGLNIRPENALVEEIEIARLDDEAIERKVDVVKCDIEGAELAFLQGARGTIERDHPLLVLEWNPSPSSYGVGEMLALLEELGYPEVFEMRRGALVRATRESLDAFGGDVVCATPEHLGDRLRGLV